MRFVFYALELALGNLTLVHAAHAQARFSIGPQVGAASSFSPYYQTFLKRPYQTRSLAGVEAGVAAAWAVGQHLGVQPALLFSQRGFCIDDESYGAYGQATTRIRLRLNYLSLPVSVAYTLQPDGQGVQVFGGAYAGVLLGGSCRMDNYHTVMAYPPVTSKGTVPVAGSGPYSSRPNDPTYISGAGPPPPSVPTIPGAWMPGLRWAWGTAAAMVWCGRGTAGGCSTWGWARKSTTAAPLA